MANQHFMMRVESIGAIPVYPICSHIRQLTEVWRLAFRSLQRFLVDEICMDTRWCPQHG